MDCSWPNMHPSADHICPLPEDKAVPSLLVPSAHAEPLWGPTAHPCPSSSGLWARTGRVWAGGSLWRCADDLFPSALCLFCSINPHYCFFIFVEVNIL